MSLGRPSLGRPSLGRTARRGDEVIGLHGGAIGYDGRAVVTDVDFVLRAGEVVALLGANGSGKTALVRGILGLTPILAGRLELFGVPAAHFSGRWRIGYVPQRQNVLGAVPATVHEVVATGRLSHKRPFTRLRQSDRAAIDAAIETVGLSEKATTNVARLSGGQQRRVLIARALGSDADVLVMDEPTAGVDLANQEILAATLDHLVAIGKTLLLVAHELGPLEPLVDRVVVLEHGRLTFDGQPSGAMRGHGTEHHHAENARQVGSALRTGIDMAR